jgi:hypothetical protein
MTDQAFELQLQAAYDSFADEAPTHVDSITLAAVVARGTARPWRRVTRPTFMLPGWVPIILGALLVIGLLGALAVGALLLNTPHEYRGLVERGPDMSVARDRPIVVPLSDDRVVIAGGQYGSAAELVPVIFDPRFGTYSTFTGDIPTGSGNGLLLPDGRVLMTAYDLLRSERGWAGIYLLDPASMTARFASLPLAPYVQSPAPTPPFGPEPAIALLHSGKVLIIGDGAGTPEGSKAFIFDPILETLTQVGSMAHARKYPSITTMNDGRVLVAGGSDQASPATVYASADAGLNDGEIFDPTTNQFTSAGILPSVRGPAESFLMADGNVLIEAWGDNTSRFGGDPALAVALDRYDPVAATFTQLEPGNWPGPPTLTQLNDGRLLLTGMSLVGTEVEKHSAPWAAIYDPVTGQLTEQDQPRAIFPQGAATADGLVVLVGGYTDPPLTPGIPAVPWVDISQ